MSTKLNFVTILILFIIPFTLPESSLARKNPQLNPVTIALRSSAAEPQPIVRSSTRHDQSAPLRAIRPNPPRAAARFETLRKLLPNRVGSSPTGAVDPVLQAFPGSAAAPTTTTNFEGIGNVNSVLPPDTNGDVGPNHYVQTVNLSFAIWNKSGTKLYGPADINILWVGFGGACETTNDGDPIVLYDHLADRWLISQFALPGFPFGPFYQCIAISQGPDPTGAYYRYEFLISNNKLNDYPKFGVWPDGYYMSINQFSAPFLSWGGQGVVVFERDRMLAGQPANMIYFDLYNTDSNLGGMLPSDLDGPPPASGTPNYFIQVDDDAWIYSPDQMQIWRFQTNWKRPNRSRFTRLALLGTAAFDSNMCGYARNCITQPGGVAVDAISDRLMYRLQFRDFGAHQSLVVNHTVDADNSDHAGIRWYELRDTGSGWVIYQQGTFAPDSDHRWMGSLAMDGSGNLALGYSVSGSNTYPSIRYTGRLSSDPQGSLPQGETALIAGSGFQNHASGRWGDYSSMSVDPVDNCTFWYTQEYYATTTSSAGWQTRIGAFKYPTCGGSTGGSLHVGDLDGSSSAAKGNRWTATVTITIHDDTETPASNATISGAWSGGFSGSGSCTTNASGLCSLSTSNINGNQNSVTFTVSSISHASLSYNPAGNHDPDTDSNGTNIMIAKP